MKPQISSENRKKLDQYFTPPWATVALLEHIDDLEGPILEPCAGAGHIVAVLEAWGYTVNGSEIDPELEPVDLSLQIEYGVDFLARDTWSEYEWIVTNPPYNAPTATGTEIMRKMITLAPKGACLMAMGWLECCYDRRDFLPQLSEILILAPRVHYLDTNGRNTTPSAWCVWREKDVDKPTRIHWLDPARGAELKAEYALDTD